MKKEVAPSKGTSCSSEWWRRRRCSREGEEAAETLHSSKYRPFKLDGPLNAMFKPREEDVRLRLKCVNYRKYYIVS